MSLSVERVRHMLDVAKRERAESWGDMDDIGRAFSNDCVAAFEELIAIKEAEPVAYIGNAYGDPVEFAEHELVVTGDIQKIPLFSHLIVRQ